MDAQHVNSGPGILFPCFLSRCPALRRARTFCLGRRSSWSDMIPDSVGTWMFDCHLSNHMKGGMRNDYEVLS